MSTFGSIRSIGDEILRQLPHIMSPKRFSHTMGVIDTGVALAERFGEDVERVRLAGASHDIARELSEGTLLAFAADWRLDLSPIERHTPVFAHGALAAARLTRQFGVDDAEVLHAVRHHTLGDPHFGTLGLILYVADFCEPGRRHLDERTRAAILALPGVGEMAMRIIEFSKRRFGSLLEPTERLYERLAEEV
ncbi:MAG: bis(5'-nucleosyl)-tetraphosphatase (symmetrical) YqeK [Spirochaetales bacterium]|nr:bis(5'-nucleosyl)-tetraphosphatase (symmetrical) YqeK [Spirochaetales bacterium]